MNVRGIFVTGTDTGVGKTAVAAGILAAMHAQGIGAVPFKPAESGHDAANGDWPTDAACLRDASGASGLARADVVPYVFSKPLAPNVAARREGRHVDLQTLDEALSHLAAHGPVVVEGAGGITVHIRDDTTMADLATRWKLPVLIVARAGLGTLNHTLLTVQHAKAHGLEVVGVVLNGAPPDPDVATATNPDELRRILAPLGVPLLGVLPQLDGIDVESGQWRPMAAAVAAHLDLAPVVAKVTG